MYSVYASNVCMHASKHLGYCDVVQEISTCAARAIQVIEAEVIAETKSIINNRIMFRLEETRVTSSRRRAKLARSISTQSLIWGRP